MTLVHSLRRQPLLGYFALAYGISWSGILVVLSFTGFNLTKLRPLDTGLIFVAMLLGPSTAGLASTALMADWGCAVRWRVCGRWYAVTLEMQKNMASTLTTARRVFARAAGSVSVQSKRTQWSSVNEAH
jgi:hypothetical protein